MPKTRPVAHQAGVLCDAIFCALTDAMVPLLAQNVGAQYISAPQNVDPSRFCAYGVRAEHRPRFVIAICYANCTNSVSANRYAERII